MLGIFITVPTNFESETSEVHGYPYDDGHRRYMLVDTPGFDDSYLSDNIIITKIRNWLHSSYQAGISLSGIVYLHTITSPRLQGSAIKHLRLFQQLIGDNNIKNVVLATTFWNEIDPVLGQRREAELAEKRTYWGQLVERGSRIMRLDRNRESAINVLNAVAGKAGTLGGVPQDGGHGEPAHVYAPVHPDPGPVPDFEADLARAAQYHAFLRAQQQEQIQRWEDELAQARERIRLQEEELKTARHEIARKRKERAAQRAHLYESWRCRCTLVGKARCRSCLKIVTKVNTSFYRKLFEKYLYGCLR